MGKAEIIGTDLGERNRDRLVEITHSIRWQRIRKSIVLLRWNLDEIEKWIDHLPSKWSESRNAWKSIEEIRKGRSAVSTVEGITDIDFHSAEEIGYAHDRLLQTALAVGSLHNYVQPLATSLVSEGLSFDVRKPPFVHLQTLLVALSDLFMEANWLGKLRDKILLPDADSATTRAKRMRDRRRLRLRVVPIELHDDEVEDLRRMGLLAPEEKDPADAVRAALTAFLSAYRVPKEIRDQIAKGSNDPESLMESQSARLLPMGEWFKAIMRVFNRYDA